MSGRAPKGGNVRGPSCNPSMRKRLKSRSGYQPRLQNPRPRRCGRGAYRLVVADRPAGMVSICDDEMVRNHVAHPGRRAGYVLAATPLRPALGGLHVQLLRERAPAQPVDVEAALGPAAVPVDGCAAAPWAAPAARVAEALEGWAASAGLKILSMIVLKMPISGSPLPVEARKTPAQQRSSRRRRLGRQAAYALVETIRRAVARGDATPSGVAGVAMRKAHRFAQRYGHCADPRIDQLFRCGLKVVAAAGVEPALRLPGSRF
jgi:hypothetical protein